MSIHSAISLLKFGSIVVILIGLLVAVGAHPATALPATWLVDLAFLPFDGGQAVGDEAARLLAAIGGGVMVGWGVVMWRMTTLLVPVDPALARRLFLEGMFAWYAVDSTCSYLAGAYFNIPANTVLLAMIIVPAWMLPQQTRLAST
ncbi:excinuclease ABC subunit A [Peteryoungia desertarenae]|uniref:Excinuclease ABC subunit A n=1 Tax=Peteryoungia desertarenae TaxID=1813451 RepID=A0ABX6QPW5_9HYPH|nr:excinuclease ABC subunit A [Peteryoungia desertarenae]QLF70529.1 excinuclease ABC subunit A [Peteryoungia desertarenae]